MGCSDAAKMLIDQMKEHPEEFRGYGGTFTSMLDIAREALQGPHRNVRMSMRDAEAILAAAETHLYEVWLAEDVLTQIMQPKPEPERAVQYATPVKAGLWQGAVPSAIYSGNGSSNTTYNTISNTSTAQYVEEVYRMEKEKYRLELEKLRHQDSEHALRTAKPFKNYL
jgi:hypothetical protein